MKGLHAAPRKKRDGRNLFADAIILLCLLVSLLITAAVLWEYHRLNAVLPAGVISALLGLWGGELLIVALRQIFGRDVVTQARTQLNDSEEESI